MLSISKGVSFAQKSAKNFCGKIFFWEGATDTSLRLAKFFGVSDAYFLNLQSDIDLRDAKKHLSRDLSAIKAFTEVQAKNKESLN